MCSDAEHGLYTDSFFKLSFWFLASSGKTTVMWLLPRLYRERLVEELLVEILLDIMDKDDRFALVIKLRPTCSPHHLQNICTQRTYLLLKRLSISHYMI